MNISKRAEFYLKHKREIEEWAQLADDVDKEACKFYLSLESRLDKRRSQLDPRLEVFVQPKRNEPSKIFLARRGWYCRGASRPAVGIGIEWPKRRVDFENAYTGVWVNQHKPYAATAPALREAIADRIRGDLDKADLESPYRMTKSTWWSCWRHERPTAVEYWNTLDDYGVALVERILRLWRLTAEHVDAAPTDAENTDPRP